WRMGSDNSVSHDGWRIDNVSINDRVCPPPHVAITKTADAANVVAGSQIGFTVRISNSSTLPATGLSVTDNLPAAPGVNWSIDAGNTDPGWSVSGSPPNQSLVYSPTTLPANSSTHVHVVSGTSSGADSCGTYNNTASFTTSNDGSGQDSASVLVCPPPPNDD